MIGIRRPRKIRNRGMRSEPRKKLRTLTASEKVGRLKDAIKRIEEAAKK